MTAYNWAWPNDEAHPGTVVHSYPVPPLPVLRAISVGRHESEHPGYDRISFSFQIAFPSYDLRWQSRVVADSSGRSVRLEGDGALRIRFTQASAHDAFGSTVGSAPSTHIGYPAIFSYAEAGDFEGVLTYGVGNFRTIPASNSQPAVRAVEIRTADGSGGYRYIVAIDIQTRGLGGVPPTAD